MRRLKASPAHLLQIMTKSEHRQREMFHPLNHSCYLTSDRPLSDRANCHRGKFSVSTGKKDGNSLHTVYLVRLNRIVGKMNRSLLGQKKSQWRKRKPFHLWARRDAVCVLCVCVSLLRQGKINGA